MDGARSLRLLWCRAVEFLGGLALGGTRPALVELEGDSVDAFRGQAGDVVLVNVAPLVRAQLARR